MDTVTARLLHPWRAAPGSFPTTVHVGLCRIVTRKSTLELNRIAIAALGFSALGLGGLAGYEGWLSTATQPLPGDKPTYAFGSTTRPDGSPVQLGDKITPPAGLALMVRTVTMKEQTLKGCINAKLFQHEYDAYVSLAYNVGAGAVCDSSIPGKLEREEYEAACLTILDFDKFRDSTKPKVQNPSTGKWEYPLVRIPGLTKRRQSEYRRCMGGAW